MSILTDEFDILYSASHRLAKASTPAEQLEAVSDYAIATGAGSGSLIYIHHDEDEHPAFQEFVAGWNSHGQPMPNDGEMLRVTDYLSWLPQDDQPLFVSDLTTDQVMPIGAKQGVVSRGYRALVLLPLSIKGRFTGLLGFNWTEPRVFNDRDHRIYTALLQQAAPVIDSMRLFEQAQRRATELEIAKNEIDMLYTASHKLAKAFTPAEQLEAVSDYARSNGANCGVLIYIEHDVYGVPTIQETVAIWLTEQVGAPPVGTRLPAIDQLKWMPTDQPLFISDTLNVEQSPNPHRTRVFEHGYRSCVILPLSIKGRFTGILVFTWINPHTFDERDQRIYTALLQQAAPVIDSVRLYEETRRRARELEKAKNEIDIVYEASNQLFLASTPADLLEAISSYARAAGAVGGTLAYIHNDNDNEPDYLDIAAAWSNSAKFLAPGDHIPLPPAVQEIWFGTHPNLIYDTWTDSYSDPSMREIFQAFGHRGAALLPLKTKDRFVGVVYFAWEEPKIFDERDQRIYMAIQQQAAPTLDSIRLYDQNQRRAARAEHLLKINVALSQANSEAEIVAAVASYARLNGARGIILNYLDVSTVNGELVQASTPVAIWQDGDSVPFDTNRHRVVRLADFGYPDLWYNNPEQALLIENIATDTRIADEMRTPMLTSLRSRAIATIPLFNGGRCQGVMSIFWFEPHTFSDQERYIYTALIQTLAAMVATRRAYLAAEAAHRESEFLYRMSEAINAATSFADMMHAIAHVDSHSQTVSLGIWENYDYENARFLEVVGAINTEENTNPFTGRRFPVEALPIVHTMPRQGLWVIEDIQTGERVDDVTKQTYAGIGTRAIIGTSLAINNRWIGILSFHSTTPRAYSEQEKRIINGIGDLVLAAVERIRLQAETETARQQAEIIAQINAALSQAANEQAILGAVAQLAERYGTSLSILSYTNLTDRLDIVGLRSSDGSSPLPLSFLPITSFSFEDYPIMQLAHHSPDDIIFIENTYDDPRTNNPTNRMFIESVNWGAVVLMPLKSAEQLQGILTFAWSDPQVFKPDIRELFAAIRATASSVVTSRRAYLAEQDARHETEQRARDLAALEERTRLARELHDSVSQALYGIGLGAKTAYTLLTRDPSRLGEPLEYILSLAEAGLTEMRALIFELRPESLEQEGLITALNKQAASLQARHGIDVKTRFCEEPLLSLNVKESLYRIAREALHNTVKHAHATHINLSLTHEEEGYQLEIADNGLGFDTGGTFPGHLGLKSMRERTKRLYGTLEMTSAPNEGTRIAVTIPYQIQDEFPT